MEYAGRLPRHCSLQLVEVPAVSRKYGDIGKIRRAEGKRLLGRIPGDCHVVALSEGGVDVSTKMLADALRGWMELGRDVALLVGGADGMSEECRRRADKCWSLSSLTFPHALVRVIVAEQIFRAWSMISNHPYHRG